MEDMWEAQPTLEPYSARFMKAHAADLGKSSQAPASTKIDSSRSSVEDFRDVVSDVDGPVAHNISESSLSEQFTQIELGDSSNDSDCISHRASGSPVNPDLFILKIDDPSLSPGHSSPGTSLSESHFDRSIPSPKFFRRSEDLVFLPSESELETGDDDTEYDDIEAPTPLPSLPGAYDSAVEDNAGPTTQNDNVTTDMDTSEGFFGRIAGIFKRTRQDFNQLIGCSGTTDVGCGGMASGSRRPRDMELSFEEIEEIQYVGSGAAGCVFLGNLHGNQVAVKKFRDHDAAYAESRALSRLSHPNIVKFMGMCTKPPVFCMVMEYCPKTLYEVIKHTRIPPTEICEWARQIAAGMAYLHDKCDQIHRDLKSPNVLLAQDNRTLRISDFGTARNVGSRSLSEKTMCGSPPWMAPELIRNEPYGKTVDVWSYGVVLWELLTGEVPYRGVEQGAIIFGVANKSLHLPVPSTVPLGFSLLLKQCWNTNPKHRPQFRQILLHLDILLQDSGFAEVPVEAYFSKQLIWKKEMKTEFEKMKQDEMEIRRTDEELLQRREEELQHVQDIRELYETRLQAVSQLLVELRDRDRDSLCDRRSEKTRRHSRKRAVSIGPGKRSFVKGSTSRRRSKEPKRRQAVENGVTLKKLTPKKFSASSIGSPGMSPLGLTAISARDRCSGEKFTMAELGKPAFPMASPPVRSLSTGSTDHSSSKPLPVVRPGVSMNTSDQAGQPAQSVESLENDTAQAYTHSAEVIEDPAPILAEPSEGWFSPKLPEHKKKWIGMVGSASDA